MLVVSEFPGLELSQPMQRRLTPCNTIFAHLTPVFLLLSQPTLVFFALKTNHIPAKMATEPLWSQQPLIDCEMGCARTEQSIVPQQLFLSISIPSGAGVASSPLPFPSKQSVPFHFGRQAYRI